MAIIPLLQLGVVTAIAQNAVFALPQRNGVILGTNPIQFSPDGTTFAADVAASSTVGVPYSGGFVRSTNAAGSIVICKAE